MHLIKSQPYHYFDLSFSSLRMHYVFNYVMNSALRQSGTQRCMKSSVCVHVSGLNQNLPITSGDMKALIKRVRSFVLITQGNYILIQEDPIRAETMNSRWWYSAEPYLFQLLKNLFSMLPLKSWCYQRFLLTMTLKGLLGMFSPPKRT